MFSKWRVNFTKQKLTVKSEIKHTAKTEQRGAKYNEAKKLKNSQISSLVLETPKYLPKNQLRALWHQAK